MDELDNQYSFLLYRGKDGATKIQVLIRKLKRFGQLKK